MTENLLAFDTGSQVATALERLSEVLARARCAILKPGAVVQGVLFSPELGTALDGYPAEHLLASISDIDCQESATNGEVWRYPGVFEVSQDVLQACAALNEAKATFEATVKALEASGVTSHTLRSAYRASGLPRLHPLQAWRRIVLLEGQPASIGFTLAKRSEGTERLTRDEAVEKLLDKRAFDIAEQLRTLDPATVLSWHTPVSPHVRANIVWGEGASAQRKMCHASLPFLVAPGMWPTKRVRFNLPRDHEKRSDAKGDLLFYLPFREGAYLKVA